jgi:hypothetical protein
VTIAALHLAPCLRPIGSRAGRADARNSGSGITQNSVPRREDATPASSQRRLPSNRNSRACHFFTQLRTMAGAAFLLELPAAVGLPRTCNPRAALLLVQQRSSYGHPTVATSHQRRKLAMALFSNVVAPCCLATSIAVRNDASAFWRWPPGRRANSSPRSRWSSAV